MASRTSKEQCTAAALEPDVNVCICLQQYTHNGGMSICCSDGKWSLVFRSSPLLLVDIYTVINESAYSINIPVCRSIIQGNLALHLADTQHPQHASAQVTTDASQGRAAHPRTLPELSPERGVQTLWRRSQWRQSSCLPTTPHLPPAPLNRHPRIAVAGARIDKLDAGASSGPLLRLGVFWAPGEASPMDVPRHVIIPWSERAGGGALRGLVACFPLGSASGRQTLMAL